MDSDMIDISNLNENFDNHWNISNSASKTTNFGSGIELLMNDKKKENTKISSDFDIEDLNNLENELNGLVDETENENKPIYENKSDLFSKNIHIQFDEKPPSVRFEGLGESIAEDEKEPKTWDGYTKFNNVPINPDRTFSQQPQMSKEELLREKFKYLRKLETLEAKGVNLTKKYNMESPLAEMQGEYEMIMEEKTKQNSVKFQRFYHISF
jgi:hypothetical protein